MQYKPDVSARTFAGMVHRMAGAIARCPKEMIVGPTSKKHGRARDTTWCQVMFLAVNELKKTVLQKLGP